MDSMELIDILYSWLTNSKLLYIVCPTLGISSLGISFDFI